MERHGDVRARRPHGERVRLAFGVLIVAAITAIGAGVRMWPASPRTAMHAPVESAPPLVSRPLPPPLLSVAAMRDIAPAAGSFIASPAPSVAVEAVTAAVNHAAPPIAADSPAEEMDDEVVPEPAGATVPAEPVPLLASRRLTVPIAMPGAPLVDDPDYAPGAAPGVVELPAIFVTRAVTVAGRGILTGLRATSAVLRAAF